MQNNEVRSVLYSFRRCPYAMRARLAIYASGLTVELREVLLRDKPAELLTLSPKATVPVLLSPEGVVVDESLDIMLWALQQQDPEGWIPQDAALLESALCLIEENDTQFKQWLDRYKYADRFPEQPVSDYRQQAEVFIKRLEERLQQHDYLISDKASLADMAVFPFIRQFAHVDKPWFDQTSYANVQRWLKTLLDSPLFADIMIKYDPWQPQSTVLLFGKGQESVMGV